MTARLAREVIRAATTQPATLAVRGRLGERCRRIHLAIRAMNRPSRRVAELQAPWSVDQQSHGR
jgi:hypothetical protein